MIVANNNKDKKPRRGYMMYGLLVAILTTVGCVPIDIIERR